MKLTVMSYLARVLIALTILEAACAAETTNNVAVFVRLLTPTESSNVNLHFREMEAGVFAWYASPSNLDEPELVATLPEAYAAFKRNVTGAFGKGDAAAAIDLVTKAGALFANVIGSQLQSPTNQDQGKVVTAYEAAWRLAIRIHKGATDPGIKQSILDQWTNALQEPDLKVAAQIYALALAWDRSLLTEDCWRILRQTKSPTVVAAFSYLVYRRGDRQDADRLIAKEKSEADLKVTAPIQNALNWWEFDRSGRPFENCPSQLAPY